MKRSVPFVVCAAGIAVLVLILPQFTASQPAGIRINRAEAARIADQAAREIGIPVDKAWSNLVWETSDYFDKELDTDPARRRLAATDPVVGPRLGVYRASYYRRGQEKYTPYGYAAVSGTGEVVAARYQPRPETPGAHPKESDLRPLADAFVRSHNFPGAPSPQFESARPTVLRQRTDWAFRYRVSTRFPIGNIVPLLVVYYNGSQFGGWTVAEEYADGTPFKYDSGSELAGQFVRFGVIYLLLLVLLIIFLKKYHAGEVGVGTASAVFAVVLVLQIISDWLIMPSASQGSNFGTVDAPWTAAAICGFKILFFDIPIAVTAFLGWAVGESYARERWGEKLASFDALLTRDPVNATLGRSLLRGVLLAPAVAASAYLVAWVAVRAHLAHPALGGSEMVLGFGGATYILLSALTDAIVYPVVSILFVLASSSRRRILPAGVLVSLILGSVMTVVALPMDPFLYRVLFGFGAIGALVSIFLLWDLLTTSVALFFGAVLGTLAPLLSVAHGDLARDLWLALLVPATAAVAFAVVALLTRREVVYSYEDLAPHVKRIVERERVKAEIDAANRIQAALLPLEPPHVHGASVSSHYRAATEIGGDYFDFLQQSNGDIGIAFGDVSGHGLTSGIVMAMAKAALLVQVTHDSSPRVVLDMLNEVVMKTAPRRMLMTFFFGVLDPRAQTLRFSSAGHLDPYVFRAATGRLEALSSWGFPLGVRRREPFREHIAEFSAGDRLVLYSDGLIEAVDDDGEPFGFDRFEHAIVDHGSMSADDIKKAILGSVRKFTRNRPPEDDQTLVVVSFEDLLLLPLHAPSFVGAVSDAVN